MKSGHVYESASPPLSSQVKDSQELSLLSLLRACRTEPSLILQAWAYHHMWALPHVLDAHRKRTHALKSCSTADSDVSRDRYESWPDRKSVV